MEVKLYTLSRLRLEILMFRLSHKLSKKKLLNLVFIIESNARNCRRPQMHLLFLVEIQNFRAFKFLLCVESNLWIREKPLWLGTRF
jgi:hypothetical protein